MARGGPGGGDQELPYPLGAVPRAQDMTCLPYVHIVETSDATKSEVRLRAGAGTSALQIGESRIYFIRQTNTYIQASIARLALGLNQGY